MVQSAVSHLVVYIMFVCLLCLPNLGRKINVRRRWQENKIFSVHVEVMYRYVYGLCLHNFVRACAYVYDSVPRGALWKGLVVLGVPASLIDLVSSSHTGMISWLQIGGQYTDDIAVNNGLRQGCSIAPVLFNLYFGLVFEKWHQEMRRLCPSGRFSFRCNINGNLYHKPRFLYQSTNMLDLEFAGAAAFMTSTRECAQVAFSVFNDLLLPLGLPSTSPKLNSGAVVQVSLKLIVGLSSFMIVR